MLFAKTLLFTLLVPGVVLVMVPLLFFVPRQSPSGPWWGSLPIALGISIYSWCARDFIEAGRGTPNPLDPPKVFVARGLYRFVRNPMYVGALLVVLGEAVLFRSRSLFAYALFLWFFYHVFVLLYEEPHLKKLFGRQYEEYLLTVPRWIPRFSPRKST